MKWNLIALELRQNGRSFYTCLWLTLVFILLLLGKAEAYVNNPDMEKLIQGMPEGLLKAFNIQLESFQTFEGFLSTQVFPYFIVILSSFAAAWAAGSIAKEQDRGTYEQLFALPYSRSTIFWSKMAAHLLHMTIVYVLSTVLLLMLAQSSGQVAHQGDMLRLLLIGYLLVLSLMGIGYGLTSWISSAAVSFGAGIAVLAFLLNLLSGTSETMEKISVISPYRWFDAFDIVKGSVLPATGWITMLGLYAVGIAAGIVILKRRDLG
ncbi:ABC transporter permease [Paenibacillus faecalis]|uniref:ABC transporter permease n=1 Tax=Paenibacillus faecalis TaxID=2079532 RepID=UPI000D100210|nr:ABC transporter permease [Paenibacillus faecalis]